MRMRAEDGKKKTKGDVDAISNSEKGEPLSNYSTLTGGMTTLAVNSPVTIAMATVIICVRNDTVESESLASTDRTPIEPGTSMRIEKSASSSDGKGVNRP